MTPLLELLSHSALKGAAVLFVALVAGLLLRKTAAARRYAIWITAVGVLAVLPVAMSLLPAWRVLPKKVEEPAWMQIEAPLPLPTIPAPNFTPSPQVTPAPVLAPKPVFVVEAAPVAEKPRFNWNQLVAYLPNLWLTVAVLLLLRLGWSAWRLRRLQQALPLGECTEIAAIAREVGLRRVPRLLIGAADAVPMVWGVCRPHLLLPRGFERWSPEMLRGVLLHELAHLRRGDPLALWAAQWMKALHWFNPLAWLTLRQLRADQERACDDTALRHGIRASDYAQSLLDLSRHSRTAPGLALCALTITRRAEVESRVKSILDPQRHREPLTRRWLIALCGVALLLLLPVAMLHAIEGAKLRGRILDRHGKVLAETTQEKMRHYPLGALTAHVTGYVGRTKNDDLTPVGRSDIEKSQEELLRHGDDVRLTLDARIQSIVLQAMQDGDIEQGSAVVLDPRTGDILAAVSLPVYDNNQFVPSISTENWETLSKNSGHPLFFRSLRGEYPPAGAFGGLTALAGVLAGQEDAVQTCKGSMVINGRIFRCWKNDGHGELNLAGAMEHSCNCYWYQLGINVGGPGLEQMAKFLGLGESANLPIQTSEGYFPTTESINRRAAGGWHMGDVANLSVGQGSMLVTPLQTAVLAATLANGGKVPIPRLIQQNSPSAFRTDLAQHGLTAERIAPIREAMRQVVNGDTATGRATHSTRFQIAAKTGTAQWKIEKDQNLAIMMGFAPFDKPTLAFAVFYEGQPKQNLSGGTSCGPIVERIVEETLSLPADGSGEVKPIKATPAKTASNEAPDAETIRSAIKKIASEMGDGFTVTELSPNLNSPRGIEIRGVASGMIQALAFRNKVIFFGKPHRLAWTHPVPETMPDGQRVRFYIKGETLSAFAESEKKRIEKLYRNPISDIGKLGWSLLRIKWDFPDPPAEAKYHTAVIEEKRRIYSFTTTREKSIQWLKDFLKENLEHEPSWPGPTGPFTFDCSVQGNIINCTSKDGISATVRISVPRSDKADIPFFRSIPKYRPPPEGPTIPKNLPEEKKPKDNRIVQAAHYGELATSPQDAVWIVKSPPSLIAVPDDLKPNMEVASIPRMMTRQTSFFGSLSIPRRVVSELPPKPYGDEDEPFDDPLSKWKRLQNMYRALY
ncbi:MAG: hypothetical protein IPK32_05675 [Verrucomicrobiaceae bacterium]|nr:hypothetical protein [Verrucomicrobiaceae bacterium]